MESKKINFFSRIKKAVIKFDDYEFFINEKAKEAIFYVLKLVLIISIIVSIAVTYKVVNQIESIYNNILNNIPDFEFSEASLTSTQTLEKVNNDEDFYFLIDTNEISEEAKTEYKNKLDEHIMGIVLLKDKVIYKINGISDMPYEDAIKSYGFDKSNVSFNKEQAEKYINENVKGFNLYSGIFNVMFTSFFLVTIISVISDVILLTILAMITSRIAKLKLSFTSSIIVGIYSITLPLILLGLYDIASTLTTFNIEFFDIIYRAIGYIYVIAAILIMKSNLIKQNVEISKIVEVQEEVRKEIEENKDNNSDDEEKNDKKDNEKDGNEDTGIDINDNEPDGRDVSWIWDINFESLKNVKRVVVSGTRPYDMAIRIKYSGFD